MLKLPLVDIRTLQSFARDRNVETCAVGLVVPAGLKRNVPTNFIVRNLQEVPTEAYAARTAMSAVLKPDYCIEIANRARAAGAGVFLAHTHPGGQTLEGFSNVDDDGEIPLARYFERRLPNVKHFAAVFTSAGVYARSLGHLSRVPVAGVGRVLEIATPEADLNREKFDRQVRAFGVDGQLILESLKIAVVGLGGTGSVVAQQLAHLGVRDFVLIDPDSVEITNLNRLVGSVPSDIGAPKVMVAARHIKSINPTASCLEVIGDILDEEFGSLLTDVDFIFGCTDSMASRAFLNQLAYQHLIPCIDIGVGIGASGGAISYITGRTQMLSPGLPCLVCTDKLDAEQIRRELLTEEQLKQDPYVVGEKIPQPAVISLNSTMSSAAITMFLAAVTAIPSESRMVIYDAIRGSLRPAAMDPRPRCIVCSYEGGFARGNTWQLIKRSRQLS